MVLLWWQSIDSYRFIGHKEMIQKAGVTINAKRFLSIKRNFCIGSPVPLYCISSKGSSSFLPAHNKRQRGKGSANLRAHCLANSPLNHCRFTALVAPYNFSLLGMHTIIKLVKFYRRGYNRPHTFFMYSTLCAFIPIKNIQNKIHDQLR